MSSKILGLFALVLFLVIGTGLLWLAVQSDNAVSALLSFAAGLSMIFLPCTLPLAFVIVPIAAKAQRPGKALGLAFAFGLGLALTLLVYGVITAVAGDYFGLDQFTRAMFIVAGLMALLFGLSELNLVRVPLPTFTHRVPNWISQGYGKTLLLGMFLGNVGIGCPNPAFYVLLTYIASTGEIATGAWLGLVHGLGRAVPLIFLVVLAVLGIQTAGWLTAVSKKINTVMGAGLVFVGAFILTYGLFGMHWWEDSVFHASWNQAVLNIAPNLAELPDHPVAAGVFEGPFWLGWWSLLILLLIPFIWYKAKHGMRRAAFWIITILLVVLGLLASTGVLEVEHGRGVEPQELHSPREAPHDSTPGV